MIKRKEHILIWNDDDIAHSIKIGKILGKEYPSFIFKALGTPKEVLTFPINPSITRAIILIDYNVTKLSEDEAVKDSIQNWLIKHLEKGGGIIGTHDVIYRRVRNDKLEKAFGCQLTEFKRVEGKVTYIKNPIIKKTQNVGRAARFF